MCVALCTLSIVGLDEEFWLRVVFYRMRDVIGTGGFVEGISTNEIQSMHVGQADATNSDGHLPSKLHNFLKKNLKSLGVSYH